MERLNCLRVFYHISFHSLIATVQHQINKWNARLGEALQERMTGDAAEPEGDARQDASFAAERDDIEPRAANRALIVDTEKCNRNLLPTQGREDASRVLPVGKRTEEDTVNVRLGAEPHKD